MAYTKIESTKLIKACIDKIRLIEDARNELWEKDIEKYRNRIKKWNNNFIVKLIPILKRNEKLTKDDIKAKLLKNRCYIPPDMYYMEQTDLIYLLVRMAQSNNAVYLTDNDFEKTRIVL